LDACVALVNSVLKQRPLTAIFNTHLHSDHCGGNAFLQSIFPDVKTLIPPGHAAFVDQWNARMLTYEPTGQHCPQFSKTGILNDGDAYVIAGKTWRIHAAPGHDPHSVVIFDETDGVLISADALWENGFGVVFPEIEGIAAFDEVELTLNTIEALKPKLVLPGHGSAFCDPAGALARARNRLAQFRNDPQKHANYAAKVLLKFKLLELQKISSSDFLNWGQSVQYLNLLFEKYPSAQSFESWFADLYTSLVKSRACLIDGEYIINTN
jgi:glyoxylase-like metal-dependent hydrolase (beta-lactamase superfamily II)